MHLLIYSVVASHGFKVPPFPFPKSVGVVIIAFCVFMGFRSMGENKRNRRR
jgi:hypothetical protein